MRLGWNHEESDLFWQYDPQSLETDFERIWSVSFLFQVCDDWTTEPYSTTDHTKVLYNAIRQEAIWSSVKVIL